MGRLHELNSSSSSSRRYIGTASSNRVTEPGACCLWGCWDPRLGHHGVTNNQSNPVICVCPAQQLSTLVLERVYAGQLENLPVEEAMLARRMPSVESFEKQLRASIPNVRCLKVLGGSSEPALMGIIGQQLNELHMQSRWFLPHSFKQHLQQLQTLVMPCLCVTDPKLELLLSLHSLAHVEFSYVDALTQDYSRNACKWHYLQLHLQTPEELLLDALSKLPLHSLTQPLTPGNASNSQIRVQLQPRTLPWSLDAVDSLAQQLTKCGVKLLSSTLSWTCCCSQPFYARPLGAELVTNFSMIAPALGLCSRLALEHMTIDQAILEAVAAVYQDTLKVLTLGFCNYTRDMQAVWHAALSGLPALSRLELGEKNYSHVIRCLAEAVAQQPAGRCIELVVFDDIHEIAPQGLTHGVHLDALSAPPITPQAVLDGAEELLAGVEVIVQDSSVLIKSKCGHEMQAASP